MKTPVTARGSWDTTIGQICDRWGGEVQTGPFGSQLHAADYSPSGIPVVMPQDLEIGTVSARKIARVSEAHARRLHHHRLQAGDIVFSRRGDVTRFAVISANEEGWLCGTGAIRIRLNCPDLDIRFAQHFLQQPFVRDWLIHHAKGVTMPNLNTSVIRALPFSYPPLAEQQRIAEIMDKADALRAKRRAALAQLDTLTQSIFLDMFGDPGTNQKNWRKANLGDVGTFVGGGTPSRENGEFFKGSICWATSKDMQSDFLNDTQEHITEDAVAGSATKLVPAGTILIVVKSKILARRLPVAISRVATCFGQDLKGFLVGARCDVDFVATSLRLGSRWLLKRARGINTEGLTLEHLKPFPLILPPLELQREFARRTAVVLALKAKTAASLEQLEFAFTSLQHRAFRGEL